MLTLRHSPLELFLERLGATGAPRRSRSAAESARKADSYTVVLGNSPASIRGSIDVQASDRSW